ncbi:hypothetical protein CFOL_v3_16211 [Cephalotus follicularis]|uniref:Membrane-associated kinase regulator 5 n=1 Tax=Cephalotus follicularis TaxID=3775 RepID=A0A1Q3BY92_CEPFO|nr:hypothetical protein CFOL_v3_16211 [Cephalotus follicularis]
MEALNFLKFWRPTTTTIPKATQPSSSNTEDPSSIVEMDDEFGDGEDSFIDLELILPYFDNKTDENNNSSSSFDYKQDQLHKSANNAGNNLPEQSPQQPFSVSSNDFLSRRRILPIEPNNSRHQSPISLLKSAPSCRVSVFKKSKSTVSPKTENEELNSVSTKTPKHDKPERSRYAVKFKNQEAATISIFTREKSLREKQTLLRDASSDGLKQFSKELVQKYLKLFKPLYMKVSKRSNGTHSDKMMGFSGELSAASSPTSSQETVPIFSPKKEKENYPRIPARIRVVCAHLGKSRSAGAAAPPPVCRSDDSLLLQHDGIQSAIMHCKRSFNSSRDSSFLSRSTSNYSSARDSSESTESDISLEKSIGSARNSNDERSGLCEAQFLGF